MCWLFVALCRWQLQNAGKKEEKYCRFCQQRYPDWRNSLTPGEITPSTPVSPCRCSCTGVTAWCHCLVLYLSALFWYNEQLIAHQAPLPTATKDAVSPTPSHKAYHMGGTARRSLCRSLLKNPVQHSWA
jgi:hypothetical protein